MPPEDVGEQIASLLLEEIEKGGVVDSTHQVCALNHLLHRVTQFNFYYTLTNYYEGSLSPFWVLVIDHNYIVLSF